MGASVRTLFFALFAFCCFGSAAQAQEFPPVHVLSEQDDDDARTCQVSNSSSKAAVESELRYNRVPIATREQYVQLEALRVYVEFNALEIPGGCVVSHRISLGNYQPVLLLVTGKAMNATVEICNKGGIMSGPSHNLQSRLNAAFRDYTSQCLSEYQKK
jgi:hypothetical protein